MEAKYYDISGGQANCRLCPHHCSIGSGDTGKCQVRRFQNGMLIAESYGRVTALHTDPIEKKPLYHYFPGRRILSAGSAGCNLSCSFCQNWSISQCGSESIDNYRYLAPAELATMAASVPGNVGLAFTYNEPLIWFEYVRDSSAEAIKRGMKIVLVSNGYINPAPLNELLDLVHAFNIDLKAFADDFYKKITGATLKPVLQTLRRIRLSGRHLEVTFLVIPGLNNDPSVFQNMIKWLFNELGEETILHLSVYHPGYRMNARPASEAEMIDLHQMAREYLHYVYLGNMQVPELSDTFCSQCKSKVISRLGYHIQSGGISPRGSCTKCGHPIVSY